MARSPDPVFILRNFQFDSASVQSLCFLDNANFLVTGDFAGHIKIWDLKKRRVIKTVKTSVSVTTVRCMDNILISQSKDNVNVWKVECSPLDFKNVEVIENIGSTFCSCELNNLDSQIVTCVPRPQQSVIEISSVISKQHVSSLDPQENLGMCMCAKFIKIDSNVAGIIVGYEGGTIVLWNLITSKKLCAIKLHQESVLSLDFHEGLIKGVSTSVDSKISVWTLENNQDLKLFKEIEITNPGINCVKIRMDGKLFATGGWDNNIRIFSMKKFIQLAVLSYHSSGINCLSFNKDNLLFAGSSDGQITVWNIYSNK